VPVLLNENLLVSPDVADDYIHTAACLHSLALEEPTVIKKYVLGG
jgi:hypothetical protein